MWVVPHNPWLLLYYRSYASWPASSCQHLRITGVSTYAPIENLHVASSSDVLVHRRSGRAPKRGKGAAGYSLKFEPPAERQACAARVSSVDACM